MDKSYGKLTVYFDEPFWVGVFERIDSGKLSVCKVTFGAEPKDFEVWDYVLKITVGLNSVRLLMQRSKKKQLIRKDCKERRKNKQLFAVSVQSRSKHCKCSVKKIS